MQSNYKLYYEMWKTHKEMLKTNKTRHRQLSPYRVFNCGSRMIRTYSSVRKQIYKIAARKMRGLQPRL